MADTTNKTPIGLQLGARQRKALRRMVRDEERRRAADWPSRAYLRGRAIRDRFDRLIDKIRGLFLRLA